MRLKEIEKRLKEITALLDDESADVDALRKEADELIEERKQLLQVAESRKKLLEDIAAEKLEIEEIRGFVEDQDHKKNYESEYRSAFVKNLLGMTLTDAEKRAFVHTTENTEALVPKELLNEIYSNMNEKHPILQDVQVLRTGTTIAIAKHTSIVAGDAKVVAEGSANDDEQNTFVTVTLSGKDFSKHVDFSYRMGKMSIPAFESYLVNEISERLGSAMASDIVAQIKSDLSSENKFAAATAGNLSLGDVLKGFSVLKATGKVVVYANSATFYGNIATMEGAKEKLTFVNNLQENVNAALLGKAIKEEDALADGEVLILDPNQFIYNIVQDVMIERDKDIKKHTHTIAGFAIAEGTMTNDKAGAIITVGAVG